jgi:hypothetical protein
MKDNKNKVKEIIKSITGDEALVIGTPVELIHFLGSPQKAVALAQIIYLTDIAKRGDGFVYKTYGEMFDVTGIKESTLRNYFKEFKEKGFFDWRIKKANAFPTVHFKFYLEKFENSFLLFLRERYSKTEVNDTSKTEESLTKNTNKELSPHLRGTQDESVKEKNKNVKEKDSGLSSGNVAGDFNNVSGFPAAPVSSEKLVSLPSSFQPSAENLYWAVANFPRKSPKLCTDSFIDYFTFQTTDRTNTLDGWQAEWRNWTKRENEVNGYNEDKLIAEHTRIKNTVLGIVHRFAVDVNSSLLHRDSFYSILCKEEHSFSKDTIDDCLELLETNGFLTRYFNDYFYVSKTIEAGKPTDVTDFSDVCCDWSEIDTTIDEYIADNKLVHRAEIGNLYPGKFQDSIDFYLRGGVQLEVLYENQDYYFSRCRYEENKDYREAVDAKHAALGIKNSLVIGSFYTDDSYEDVFDENYNEADYPEFADYHAAMKARRENLNRESTRV